MRASIAIGLMALLLAPFAGTYLWYGWKRWQARQQARAWILANVGDAVLICFRGTSSGLRQQMQWVGDDEFIFEGQWYDVVHRTQRGDSLIVWCLPDSAETALENAVRPLLHRMLCGDGRLNRAVERLWLLLMTAFWEESKAYVAPTGLYLKSPISSFQRRWREQIALPPLAPPPEYMPCVAQ